MSRIHKLYLSNLLTGMVFWYGIEKLFMQSIGIDAFGIGLISALSIGLIILFDLPAGLIADRWSRKGQLIISAVALAISSLIFGFSGGLAMYAFGCVLYVVYVVSTSGTYQAILYDILHEENRTNQYAKIQGRAYALYLCGAGLANILSGYIAQNGLRLPFFISIVPPILNILLLVSIHEPTFHKESQQKQFIRQFKTDARVIMSSGLVRSLALLWALFAVIGTFTLDFGQLYILEFTRNPVYLGYLWAVFAFALAVGSFIAHRLHAHLGYIIYAAMFLMITLSVTRKSWALLIFMMYAIVNTAAVMLIENRIQDSTPSAIRASILSFLSTVGNTISLPAALIMGWLIRQHNIFWAVGLMSLIALIAGGYWFVVGSNRLKNKTIVS
ncbi:MAG: hypothetical protein QG628_810 [Patescibacteria group bacterium]|nr:hypothetical protein [Patescibacteria group bacterium]